MEGRDSKLDRQNTDHFTMTSIAEAEEKGQKSINDVTKLRDSHMVCNKLLLLFIEIVYEISNCQCLNRIDDIWLP